MTSRHHGRTLTLAAGPLPALGEHMQQIAIALACLAIVLGLTAALALVRNGGAE